jgi:hypothetical protein
LSTLTVYNTITTYTTSFNTSFTKQTSWYADAEEYNQPGDRVNHPRTSVSSEEY